MVRGIERREKCFVDVITDTDVDGIITPLAINWDDGRCFIVDRTIERRYAASMKVGGHGMRYAVVVEGKPTFLWHDGERWYVERIVHDGITAM